MKKILFVCTGNSCRSVMAAGLFKKMTEGEPGEYEISSAGVSAVDGFRATEETVSVMKNEGVDVSDHRSRRLTLEMIEEADHIFVMERFHGDWIARMAPHAKDKVALLTDYAPKKNQAAHHDIDIPDPIHMSGHFYKNVLTIIRDCIGNILKVI